MAIADSANNLKFATSFPIDKILVDDGTASYLVGSGSPTIPTSSTQTTTNPTGLLVLPNGMFSIDGSNFYPMGARIEGAVSGSNRQWAECIMTASTSTLTFYMQNGFTTDTTFTIRYTLESIS
jgi:hypothetical protein